MIKRTVHDHIRDFMLHDKRALLITGARQVGKTFLIRQVGKECFENVVEINFVEHPEAVTLFAGARGAKDLLLRLSAFAKAPLVPGKTLIFFDEVQRCKEIVSAIKFLVDEGSFKYAMSGSLLGVELNDLLSVPVGYVDTVEMHPVDLLEFFEAIGIGQEVISNLRDCFVNRRPVDDFVHNKMLEAIRLYLIVGGMPAAVQKYLDTNNLMRVREEQEGIIHTYRWDISQYDPTHKLQIVEIFDLIPSELNAKNKRFILKELNQKARYEKYDGSFIWLREAGVAIPTHNVEEPRIPFLLSRQRNLFKLFLNDVGLLAAMYGGNIQMRLLSDEPGINFGAIYENLVAQELYAHGFATDQHSLYYFNSKRQGELDFLIEEGGHAEPIEVKSGKDYDRHNALSNVMSNVEYDVQTAYVFSTHNVREEGRIVYLPIYMVAFLHKEQAAETVYKFDATGLR